MYLHRELYACTYNMIGLTDCSRKKRGKKTRKKSSYGSERTRRREQGAGDTGYSTINETMKAGEQLLPSTDAEFTVFKISLLYFQRWPKSFLSELLPVQRPHGGVCTHREHPAHASPWKPWTSDKLMGARVGEWKHSSQFEYKK